MRRRRVPPSNDILGGDALSGAASARGDPRRGQEQRAARGVRERHVRGYTRRPNARHRADAHRAFGGRRRRLPRTRRRRRRRNVAQTRRPRLGRLCPFQPKRRGATHAHQRHARSVGGDRTPRAVLLRHCVVRAERDVPDLLQPPGGGDGAGGYRPGQVGGGDRGGCRGSEGRVRDVLSVHKLHRGAVLRRGGDLRVSEEERPAPCL